MKRKKIKMKNDDFCVWNVGRLSVCRGTSISQGMCVVWFWFRRCYARLPSWISQFQFYLRISGFNYTIRHTSNRILHFFRFCLFPCTLRHCMRMNEFFSHQKCNESMRKRLESGCVKCRSLFDSVRIWWIIFPPRTKKNMLKQTVWLNAPMWSQKYACSCERDDLFAHHSLANRKINKKKPKSCNWCLSFQRFAIISFVQLCISSSPPIAINQNQNKKARDARRTVHTNAIMWTHLSCDCRATTERDCIRFEWNCKCESLFRLWFNISAANQLNDYSPFNDNLHQIVYRMWTVFSK